MHLVPIGGLCNRLRAIMSHAVVAAAAGEVLHVYWYPHIACPARFDELFRPLPESAGVVIHEMRAGDAGPPVGFIQTCGVASGAPEEDWPVRLLLPVKHIQVQIDALKARLGPVYVAVHIRRTDHNKNYAHDVQYSDWIRARIKEHIRDRTKEYGVYIASDNPQSVGTLKRSLGDGIVYNGQFSAVGIRMTAVTAAVVDLWICSGAAAFRGTFYSSFSDWIEMMRRSQGLPPGDLTQTTDWRYAWRSVPDSHSIHFPRMS